MKKHSTGALTKEQKAEQDKRYEEKHEYDYLIIGSGSAALTVGSLLANKGFKICMLEAHDQPGGYAHTFETGGFYFCSQIHYIWDCAPGCVIYEFIKKLGLENDITFNLYDHEGYDMVRLPDGKNVKIPCGYDKLVDNIEAAYPGQRTQLEKFVGIIQRVRNEIRNLPPNEASWWSYVKCAPKITTLIKYHNKTLQDVFDECKLSKEAQSILIADAGDMGLPPKDLSFMIYTGLFGGYNTGAYYPTKHFKYYIARLAQAITDKKGCHIYYEMPVTEIQTEGDTVTGVKTKDGKLFTAKNYICNMDPQTAAGMIGWDKFPKSFHKKLKYDYSYSSLVIYLGLKDIDLTKHGFGRYNIWHLEDWDMNRGYTEQIKGNFENIWWFMSTPTLHSDQPGTVPEKGNQILEIATLVDYGEFKEAQDRSYAEYNKRKMEIANKLLEMVEKRYIPDLKKHIVVKVIGSPTTNEDFVLAPQGNAYGSHMTPANIGPKRLKAETPFSNLWWCNASSGYAGVNGTVGTGVNLYMKLTGDKFFDSKKKPTDDELIAALRKTS